MKLSVITDEVSSDIETALEVLHTWGVAAAEIRYLGAERFPIVADYWKSRLPDLLSEFDMHVAAISPGLFQYAYPSKPGAVQIFRSSDMAQVQRSLDARALLDREIATVLPAAIEAALRLGAPTIVCFGFDRDVSGPAPDEVIQVIRHAATLVGQAGLTLALEPHSPSAHVADLVRRVDHPALGLNWDPANSYAAGEDVPFPDGYTHVRGLVRHVHFKDALQDPLTGRRTWTLANGVIDWTGAIAALHADGYQGYVSVETHVRPKVEGSRHTVERVRRLIAGASEGPTVNGTSAEARSSARDVITSV